MKIVSSRSCRLRIARKRNDIDKEPNAALAWELDFKGIKNES